MSEEAEEAEQAKQYIAANRDMHKQIGLQPRQCKPVHKVDLEEVENAEYAISVFDVRETQRNQLKAVTDAAEQKSQ